jgi:hypothetical protein
VEFTARLDKLINNETKKNVVQVADWWSDGLKYSCARARGRSSRFRENGRKKSRLLFPGQASKLMMDPSICMHARDRRAPT